MGSVFQRLARQPGAVPHDLPARLLPLPLPPACSTSYPECCHSKSADQTECEDYNGCKWEGQFAGVGYKPKSWVKEHNIVAFYRAPESRNRKVCLLASPPRPACMLACSSPGHPWLLIAATQPVAPCTMLIANVPAAHPAPPSLPPQEWDSKWKNKALRIRNPQSGKVMEALVVDTCSDSDCNGCCSKNAKRHGGTLIDLEHYTAQRFWGGSVPDLTAIQWQEV